MVDGSRSNLNAEIGFRLVQRGEGLQLAGLSKVDGLVRSIATLGPPPREPEAISSLAARETAAVEQPKTPGGKAAKVRAATASNAVPKLSLDPAKSPCAGAASRSEQIVCANDDLSSLDRQLALLYRQSWKEADEKKRAGLIRTRQRFNDRRDACGSSNCMTTAYVTRLREIGEIMAGKGQQ